MGVLDSFFQFGSDKTINRTIENGVRFNGEIRAQNFEFSVLDQSKFPFKKLFLILHINFHLNLLIYWLL